MMTEDEAKKKACPHMTYCYNPSDVSNFNTVPQYEQSSCIGSACMAWRTVKDPNVIVQNGYCGLAGKP